MCLAVTGSVATDHLMTFPGRFGEQLVADHLHTVSLSFLVDTLQVRRGGVAANIAIGLGRLGLTPLIVGADFDDYAVWLKQNGVDTAGIRTEADAYTARFLCTTDLDQNQIAFFYPGAMSRARDIDLNLVLDASGPADLVVVAPDDPEAMVRHTGVCRARGIAFAADPSQQLARLDSDSITGLFDGAAYLFTNGYERALLLQRTGWSERTVLERVGAWVTTLGADGARVDRADEPTRHIPAVPVPLVADPTGVGDAFRAGFLAAAAWGLDDTAAARLGCAMPAGALQTVGTQDYLADTPALVDRLARAYGAAAAAEVAPLLPGSKQARGSGPVRSADIIGRHSGDHHERF